MAYSKDTLNQLGNPSGPEGNKILSRLNKVNVGINSLTKLMLEPQPSDYLLEIGFGGGALITEIVEEVLDLKAIGADISALAVSEAEQNFKEIIKSGNLQFVHLSTDILPFFGDTFSKVCCVNVIYFWGDVQHELQEIYRVISPGGTFVISYAFVSPDKITKFAVADVENWLSQTGFVNLVSRSSKDRENGHYFCTTAQKSFT